MNERTHKTLAVAEIGLLLFPLTAFTTMFVIVSYCAYPLPRYRPIQIAFDAGVLLQVAGICAAWRLIVRYVRRGRSGLRDVHGSWFILLGTAAGLGAAGALVAAKHKLTPHGATELVGFALLAPSALLVPVWFHLRRVNPTRD